MARHNPNDSIDLKNLANPLYSKAARHLRKDWIVKKKQLDAINTNQLTTKQYIG